MGFYRDLSSYYDEIFAVDGAEMRFVAGLLDGRREVLDIGCGTGNKTVLLQGKGVRLTGVDSDEAMIAKALADNARENITYRVLGMEDLEAAFAPGSFDAAVCLGNTLVHLPGHEAITAFCSSVHRLLVPGSPFVCQILNYARILDDTITALPVIDTPRARFSRFYAPLGDRLAFKTELLLKDTGETLRNETPLYPLRPEALEKVYYEAGFTNAHAYGSYEGAPFTRDSFVIIVAAVA